MNQSTVADNYRFTIDPIYSTFTVEDMITREIITSYMILVEETSLEEEIKMFYLRRKYSAELDT